MVQVGNNLILFVLIENPISKSEDVFFSAITNNSSRCDSFLAPWSFRSINTCCMLELFGFR